VKIENNPAESLQRAEARLPRLMAGAALVGTVAVLAGGGAGAGIGFALGAALALLNFRWLHQAVRALMNAGQARPPRGLILKFLIRYPLAFGAVYFVYRTGWLPLLPILAGLFVPVVGALAEAVLQLRGGLLKGSRGSDLHLPADS
jgi:ATP synthase I chain